LLSYQVQALLLRAKADTDGIRFVIDPDLDAGEFCLVSEDESDDESDIVEIRVNGYTVLDTVSAAVSICTSCDSKWLDFLSYVPFLGTLSYKIHRNNLFSRYRAEFG
jgi:hypothetical protein